jgi:hypothetical protein
MNPRYVVDTCSLTALRRLYPSDVFAPVWDFVGELAGKEILVSVDEVYEELAAQDDEVLEWARRHKSVFRPLTLDVQAQAKQILSSHTDLYDPKKRTSSADPFLIGLARQLDAAVVTEEGYSTGRRPKIPDVCRDYGVECIDLLTMLRHEGLRLRRA